MDETFIRERALLGDEAMQRLASSSVAVFGIGGVGSYCAEALVRSGIGELWFIDGDTVAESNLNRQLVALRSTIGKSKAEVMAARALDINPNCRVVAVNEFYCEENAESIDLARFSFVVDAIDSVTSKLLLIERCNKLSVPMISCMGAGNKLNPMGFEAADIYSTSVCPLARVMRTELRRRGITSLRVVYSKESPISPEYGEKGGETAHSRRQTPGSTAFTPGAAGLLLAAEAVKHIAQNRP